MAFLSQEGDYFTVELRGGDLQASLRVYAYTHGLGLSDLFASLAKHERPWIAQERWESIEGEFSLSASCSPLGIVTFLVAMFGHPGFPEEWRVSASITTELGLLPSLAAGAQRFFGGT